MNLYNIVMKINGPIDPVGESCADERRCVHLINLFSLVEDLVADIARVAAENKGAVESSRQRAGKYADAFLKDTLGIEGR